MKRKVAYLFFLIVLATACWLSTSLLWGVQSSGLMIVLVPICWLVTLGLVLLAKRLSAKVWILAGLFILAGLLLPTSVLIEPEYNLPLQLPQPVEMLMGIAIFLMPSIALVIAALLLYSGLTLYKEWHNPVAVEGRDLQTQRKQAGRAAAVSFVLSALVLAKTLHNLYWIMVWDTTSDSIGYLWLVLPLQAGLYSGVLLLITLSGRTKLAGLFYALLILLLIIAVSARGQSVDFRQLTEERAGQVSQAIETYYTREGRYLQALQKLTPWYILSLPEPVIINGQGWCYDGGNDYYRLGYVYREHWSSPLFTGRIYKTKGVAPDLHPICSKEIAALQKRFP